MSDDGPSVTGEGPAQRSDSVRPADDSPASGFRPPPPHRVLPAPRSASLPPAPWLSNRLPNVKLRLSAPASSHPCRLCSSAPWRCRQVFGSRSTPALSSAPGRERWGRRSRSPGHCPAWANTTGIFCTAVLHPGRHSADKQRQVPGRPSREQQTDQREIPDVQASRDALSESAAPSAALTDLLISERFVY